MITLIFNEGGRPRFTVLCPSPWAQSLCEEQIGKVKDDRDRQDKKLSDQNDKS